MLKQAEMKRPKYWDQVKEELSSIGYTLKQKLSDDRQNSSSSSEVWLAEHADAQGQTEDVALKLSSRVLSLLNASNIDDLGKIDEHTQREIDIMRKISHPNIPQFKAYHRIPYADVATIDVLAMQYIPMPNLLERVKRRERLQEPQAQRLLEDILSGLDHIHTELGEQVLHRDIKPSNILFDGEGAFLFDFNFSRMGEVTSSSTFIDNHGYYPYDAYSGKQTPSQDLVALGNTVIAAALGKEIGAVRDDQGKDALEPVETDAIPFSPKLQRFLKKLTAANPAFRYQSAQQALQDLRNIHQLTEAQLETKATSILRNAGLEKLLQALKQQDRLFEHNVPSALRQRYDDDRLLEYLRQTYTQERFVIEDPKEISNYALPGDKVVKRGDFVEILVNTGEIVKLDFMDYTSNANSNVKLKSHKGQKRGITIPRVYLGKDTGVFVIKCRYEGPPIPIPEGTVVPDGAEGIILDNPNPYWIVWANRPGLHQSYELIIGPSKAEFSPKKSFYPKDSFSSISHISLPIYSWTL